MHKILSTKPSPEKDWPTYTDLLAPFVARLPGLPSDLKDPQLRQEFYKWLYSQAAQGYFGLLYQDTEYPDFWPVFNQAFNFGFPNPDDSYYMAVVDDNGAYKISGDRGTVYILDFQIGSNLLRPYGMGAVTAAEISPPVSNYDLDRDAHIGDDGSFEVILSPSRPPGYDGDWWELKPKATFILVRQRCYDWLGEVDGRLAIERLDRPAIKPREGAEQLAQRLAKVGEWMENWTKLESSFCIDMRERGLINKVEIVGQPGGVTGQQYLLGMFDIAPDEALILETEIPRECHYWMFHVTDEMMSAIDTLNRQTSLNGYSAMLDQDGKFRAVICAEDPGVPNWLDTAGYARGAVVGRWMYCSNYPEPTVTKIKLADVRRYLPTDAVMVSAEERDASIRVRRKSAQLRRRW